MAHKPRPSIPAPGPSARSEQCGCPTQVARAALRSSGRDVGRRGRCLEFSAGRVSWPGRLQVHCLCRDQPAAGPSPPDTPPVTLDPRAHSSRRTCAQTPTNHPPARTFRVKSQRRTMIDAITVRWCASASRRGGKRGTQGVFETHGVRETRHAAQRREREAQGQAGTEAANWRSPACGADRAQGAEGTRHRRHTTRETRVRRAQGTAGAGGGAAGAGGAGGTGRVGAGGRVSMG
jgi:hypothetical protein